MSNRTFSPRVCSCLVAACLTLVAQGRAWDANRVTNRPGNTKGKVFVPMYHHIRSGRGPMFRSVAKFRADLEQYYKLGFRPVLASEYLANKMPLPPGASPIILTFDDSNPSQIQLKKDGSVTPNCAVGIWMEFAKTHPDFPVHGTFFVLPDSMWGMSNQAMKKAKILQGLGSELANHTVTHPFLDRISDARVEWELARSTERLEKFGVKPPDIFALPYGALPRHTRLLKGFKWKKKRITFSGVFMAWGGPAFSPEDSKFNRLRITRMEATSGSDSTQSYLRDMKKGLWKPYVQP